MKLLNGDDSEICREIAYFCFEDKIGLMQQTIQISTPSHNGLFDITREVEAIVSYYSVSVQSNVDRLVLPSRFSMHSKLCLFSYFSGCNAFDIPASVFSFLNTRH